MMDRLMILMLVGVMAASALEISDGSFPTGTDYRNEKERQGGDPANYKKVYHRVLPGGAEHAEVVASNSPGSNSWSQTYSKHQSFGSADTVQGQSFSSTNNGAKSIGNHVEEAMARHNEIMSSIQNSMGMGFGGMGMGMHPYGMEQPKFFAAYNDWMKEHVRMINEIMRMQNAQIQALQQLIAASSQPVSSYNNNPKTVVDGTTSHHYYRRRLQDKPEEEIRDSNTENKRQSTTNENKSN